MLRNGWLFRWEIPTEPTSEITFNRWMFVLSLKESVDGGHFKLVDVDATSVLESKPFSSKFLKEIELFSIGEQIKHFFVF